MAKTPSTLYENDYYTWALTQAQTLRQGRFNELDLRNLAEEVEDMARHETRELENRLEVVLAHLLKWAYQPDARSKSWRLTIREQRLQVHRLLSESPGMKPKAPVILTAAYETARLLAARETPLEEDDFPATCPWTLDQTTDDGFLPEAAALEGNGKRSNSTRQRRGHRRA
jgi:hypothetical protein